MSDFRHLRDELHAGHGSHTGQRAYQLCIVRDFRLGFDERADVSLDLGDLAIEDFDEAADAFDHGAVPGFAATVLLLGSHEDQLIRRFASRAKALRAGVEACSGAGRMARAKAASIRASIGSVLASWPLARANREPGQD